MAEELSPTDFELDSPNLPSYFLKEKDCVAVFFYLDGCKWCVAAENEWDMFAKTALIHVKKFESRSHPALMERLAEEGFVIRSFPTFVFYSKGEPVMVHDKNAKRTTGAFLCTAIELLKTGCNKK